MSFSETKLGHRQEVVQLGQVVVHFEEELLLGLDLLKKGKQFRGGPGKDFPRAFAYFVVEVEEGGSSEIEEAVLLLLINWRFSECFPDLLHQFPRTSEQLHAKVKFPGIGVMHGEELEVLLLK